MARAITKIRTDIWHDPKWIELTRDAQLLALFLFTLGPGVRSDRRIQRRTGWNESFVISAREELANSAYGYLLVAPALRRKLPRWKIRAVLERDGYVCLHCGTTDKLTIDHIWPVSKDGDDDLDNLQTLCHSCNSKKGART